MHTFSVLCNTSLEKGHNILVISDFSLVNYCTNINKVDNKTSIKHQQKGEECSGITLVIDLLYSDTTVYPKCLRVVRTTY